MKLVRTATLAAVAALTLAGLASAEPRTFTFDKSHSEVGFNIKHFFSKVHGRFEDYTGSIVYDDKNLAKSSVEVTIADSTINTQNARRDAHLRTQDFFWTEKHPTITFQSTKVMPGKDAQHFKVPGNLTIRGITKPVTLDAELLGIGAVSSQGKSMGTRAGFQAKTTVNRKDFEILWNKALDNGNFMLGDEVEIVLNIEAVQVEKTADNQ